MKSYSVRIISLDSCMSSPIQGLDVMYSEFRGASINQVPILRLFGSTSTGEKICVHIHGVFPYIYIPYDGTQEANSLMYKIAASIDKAVNISLNQASSNSQHVYKITLVKGIPMYGYHLKEHQFFKIYLYNPLLVRKVTSLLMNESTLGKLYQPHEAHLNFTLQFMIDFNLHGMSNMVVSEMKFRRNPDNPSLAIDPEDLLPATITKISVCELEADCLAEHILNREEVASGNIAANPGIAALWEDERQRRRNKGGSSQIEHLLELHRTNVEQTKSHFLFKQVLKERLSVLSTEKNTIDKVNASVYPAETPDYLTIKNASMIESQTPSSLELSLNETSLNDLDETMRPSQDSDVDMTLDQDALNLLELLNELGENAEETAEDSILTQVVKEDEEEKDLDLTMPLEAVMTPKKIVPTKDDNEESDVDLWNTTLIPQLDGEGEDVLKNLMIDEYLPYEKEKLQSSVINKKTQSGILIKKALFIKLVNIDPVEKDMPDLDRVFSEVVERKTLRYNPFHFSKSPSNPKKCVRFKRPLVTVFGERRVKTKYKRRKLSRKELKERAARRTQEDVKRLGNRIKKLNRQDQIFMIMKKLHKKENRIVVWLNADGEPKFRVLSKDEVKAPFPLRKPENEKEFSKINIISDIIVKTASYIDPTLHLRIKYPNHCCYLYNYNKKIIPDVIRIPRKICQGKSDEIEAFIKQNLGLDTKVKIEKKFEEMLDFDDTFLFERELQKPKLESISESSPYIFSDKYLADIKDPSLVENMHYQTRDQLRETAESLRTQLEEHIRLLRSPSNSFDDDNNNNFSSEDERSFVLGKIKCLSNEEKSNDFDNNGASNKDRNNVICSTTQEDFHESVYDWNMYKPRFSISKEIDERVEPLKFIKNDRDLKLNSDSNVRKSPRLNSPEYGKRRSERFRQVENDIRLFCNSRYDKDKIRKGKILDWGCNICLNGTVDSCSSGDDCSRSNRVLTKRYRRKRTAAETNESPKTTEPIRRSERIRAIQMKNFLFSLDGTVDSSSSDEEKVGTKRKKSSKRTPVRESRRYKALPISVNKSPKAQVNPNESVSIKRRRQ